MLWVSSDRHPAVMRLRCIQCPLLNLGFCSPAGSRFAQAPWQLRGLAIHRRARPRMDRPHRAGVALPVPPGSPGPGVGVLQGNVVLFWEFASTFPDLTPGAGFLVGDAVVPSVPQVMLIRLGGVDDEIASGWGGTCLWLSWSSRTMRPVTLTYRRVVCLCLGV